MATTTGLSGDEVDLILRQPLDEKTLKRIDDLVNVERAWTPLDNQLLAGYAVVLLLEVRRLQIEARERERDLARDRKVVTSVTMLRDRLRNLLRELPDDDKPDANNEQA